MLSKIERQKNNRIYGNAANQVFRSSSDDDANMRIFFEYFLLFYLIYVFSLIIRLVFSIYTKACYQCVVRRNVFDNNTLEIPENKLPLSVVWGAPSGLRPMPYSQPLIGIRLGEATKNRDGDESQPLLVITLNLSNFYQG